MHRYATVASGDLDAAGGLQRELLAAVELCRQGEFLAGLGGRAGGRRRALRVGLFTFGMSGGVGGGRGCS